MYQFLLYQKRCLSALTKIFKHIESCLANPLFTKLFSAQATLVIYVKVSNHMLAYLRLHPQWGERYIFETNILKPVSNRHIFKEPVKLLLYNRGIRGPKLRMTWKTQLLQKLHSFYLHMSFRGTIMFSWFAMILYIVW